MRSHPFLSIKEEKEIALSEYQTADTSQGLGDVASHLTDRL
jgi:hypothetical protein